MSLLSGIAKKSIRRAIRTRSRWWFSFSIFAFVLRFLLWMWKRHPEIIQKIRLRPGEAITISVPSEETSSPE